MLEIDRALANVGPRVDHAPTGVPKYDTTPPTIEMAAFDRLPKKLRARLNYATYSWSAAQIEQVVIGRVPLYRVMPAVRALIEDVMKPEGETTMAKLGKGLRSGGAKKFSSVAASKTTAKSTKVSTRTPSGGAVTRSSPSGVVGGGGKLPAK